MWSFVIVLSSLLNLSSTVNLSGDIDLSTFTSTQGFQIQNTPSNSANVGQSVCYADVNNDGIKDLVIGNSMASPSGRTNAGVVNVVFGTSSSFGSFDLSSITSAQGFKMIGATAGDNLGAVVLCPGDLNGDSIGDIVFGAPAKSSSAGIVYVIFGRASGNADIDLASLTTTQGITVYGTGPNAELGISIGAADLNSDARKELLLGVPGANSGQGAIFIIYGTAIGSSNINLVTFPNTNGYRISGPTSSYKIGASVSYAGDFNHDGKDDFIFGASSASATSRPGSGLAYIIYGGGPTTIDLTSLTTQGFVIQGANVGDGLGNSVSYAGDINSDGIADVIISSSTASPSSLTGAGCSYVIYGKVGGYSSALDLNILTTSQGFVIFGANVGDGFGSAVTNAGDINGDGIADVLIAAPGFDSSLSRLNAGAFYVIFGITGGTFSSVNTSNITLPQGFKIMGVAASDGLGQSVNFIGDVNQDGYNDMLVRAPLSTNAGAVYVVYGGPLSYEYWDGTFLPSCDLPLTTAQNLSTGIISCDYSCTNPVDYLFLDGTCSSCNLPLSPRVFKGKFFCDFPCTNATDFLYWNGSCIPSYCPAPMVIQKIAGYKLCNKPCSDSNLYYYIDDQKCRPECPSPYTASIKSYGNACSLVASPQDVEDIKKIVNAMNIATSVSFNGLFTINIMLPGLSVAATSASLARSVTYARYLNITASPRLKLLYANFDANYGVPYIPNLPANIHDEYNYPPVLPTFNQYGISASFLVNYWGAFMDIALVLAVFIPLLGLDCITRKRPHQNFLFRTIPKLRIIAQNFVFNELYENFGNLFLFALLEIHTQIYGSVGLNASLGFAIFCLLTAIGVLVFHFLLLKRFRKAILRSSESSKRIEYTKEFKQKYAGFQILFDDFKETHFILQAFLLFFRVKDILFQIILISLHSSPLVQILFIILLNVVIIFYLFRRVPYKEIPELLQAIALELIALIINMSLFQVEILDMNTEMFNNVQYYLGEAIIYSSLAIHCVPILFLIVKLILLVKMHWQTIKMLSLKALEDIGLKLLVTDQETQITNKKTAKKNRTIRDMITAITKRIIFINKIKKPKSSPALPTSQELDSPAKPLMKIERPQSSILNDPTSQELDSPRKSLINSNPSPSNTAKLESQSPVAGTAFGSVQNAFRNKYKLRPAISHAFASANEQILTDVKENNNEEQQRHIQAEEIDKNEVIQLDMPPLNVPINSSAFPQRRDSANSLEKSSDEREKEEEKEDKVELGSAKHLLDEIGGLLEDFKRESFDLNKKRRTRPLGRPNRKFTASKPSFK